MLNFTLRQLEYFRAAATEGSISAAAAKERVSRSALAAAISDLESVLGRRVFHRQKAKGVVLTPFGVQLYEMGQDVLESASRIAASLSGDELVGRLSIGCFTSLGPTIIPTLFDHFRTRHPGVTLDLHTGGAGELDAMLRGGEIELAVGYSLRPSSELELEELFTDHMHVILPGSHHLAQRSVVRAADLLKEAFILLDAAPAPDNVQRYFATQGMQLRPTYRIHEFEVVRSLVARGVGYSIVIQRPASDQSYEGLDLVARPLYPRPGPTPVVCAWRTGHSLTPPARAARVALRTLAQPPHQHALYGAQDSVEDQDPGASQ